MSDKADKDQEKIIILKSIIKRLHEGAESGEVKRQLKEIVRETTAAEIAAMEQQLIAEGMKAEEIQSMCDLHAQVLREVMAEPGGMDIEPGHPVDTFLRENRAIELVVSAARATFGKISKLPGDGETEEVLAELRSVYNDLMDIEKHYLRKEYLLFPALEKHGVTGPSQVMWGKHDEIRTMLKQLDAELSGEPTVVSLRKTAGETAETVFRAIEEMIYKEEKILLPMTLEKLTDEEWAEVWRHSPEYGWCLVEPQEGFAPPVPAVIEAESETIASVGFPAGSLNPEQIRGLISTLPADLTFVDDDDRVRFFHHGPDSVFSCPGRLTSSLWYCVIPSGSTGGNLQANPCNRGRPRW